MRVVTHSRLAEGNAHRAAGRNAEAAGAYREVIAAEPGNCAAHYNLGVALASLDDPREAIRSFRRASQLAHADGWPRIYGGAVQSAATLIAKNVEHGGPAYFPLERRDPVACAHQPVSIVACSIRPDRRAAMEKNFREALGGREHEFIVIDDARSLCEGYTRGLERSRHGIVVFSHDDVAFLSASPFDAIERALAEHDVVGFAGSDKVRGPAVMWAGHPHLRGFVATPVPGDSRACNATLFSLECGTMGGMQALDGFCFAARRESALAVGFDSATFDGFHFYDLDFTYRAFLAGQSVAVTTDVVAAHMSLGNFEEAWKLYAQRFVAKFPKLDGVRGSNEHYAARLSSPENALRFYEEVRGLAAC
ncbi:MAG TPA: glycosyltransferase [Usitatibacter sp.]|nr:glycosyltransferase [Usitatibacter sp.]